MKITIDTDLCKNFTLDRVLIILLARIVPDIPELYHNMIKEDILRKETDSYSIAASCNSVVDEIILDSESSTEQEDRFMKLADYIIDEFPKGKKNGSNQYWRSNRKEISLRLKKFFKLFGDKWSRDDLIKATRRYVQSFNGNYKYMRVLKYFIWKVEKKQDDEGNTISCETSDLATILENMKDGDTADNNDWTNELR